MREADDGLIAGRYRTNRKIGEGAIGEVWEGLHVPLGIKIAIKRLLPAHLNNPELIARFRREAYLLGRARSEHVARVIDFVYDDASSGPALVMEFIDGESLYGLLQRRLLSVEEAVSLGADVLTGLDELHRAKVVHRDLKPGNIIIEKRSRRGHRAVIVDFGMGRIINRNGGDVDDEPTGITRNGIALGTLEYMAPEQILNSRGVTGAADLYALGAILYRSLTGRFPFTGETPMALVRAKLTDEAPPLVLARGDALAQGLVQIVARALSRDLGRRYASAEEMLASLHDLRAGIPPSQAMFASSPAVRLPSFEALPPLSIPPPPQMPSLPGPRHVAAHGAPPYGPMLDDETIEMPPGPRRAPAGTLPAIASMAPAPAQARPVAHTYGPAPAPPLMPASRPGRLSNNSVKLLGLTALAFCGMLVGGGLGLVYVLRREMTPPSAEAGPRGETGDSVAAPPEAPAKAVASQTPEAPPVAHPAGSGSSRNVIHLDDLPADSAGQTKPSRPRGNRLRRSVTSRACVRRGATGRHRRARGDATGRHRRARGDRATGRQGDGAPSSSAGRQELVVERRARVWGFRLRRSRTSKSPARAGWLWRPAMFCRRVLETLLAGRSVVRAVAGLVEPVLRHPELALRAQTAGPRLRAVSTNPATALGVVVSPYNPDTLPHVRR